MNNLKINEIKTHLTDNIIPFWKALRDDEFGGFYGEMDYELRLNKKADKGGILNSRILWFFSNAYLVLGDKTCLDYAKHAYEFLKNTFTDKKHGGILWSEQDDTKYTYNQAFAVYALSSYYAASKDTEALNLAYELVRIIETLCRDNTGYLEAFDREFKPIENNQLSENNIIAERTMNTLLHVYEAYTELYRVDENPEMAARLTWLLDIFAEKIYNPQEKRLDVFFDLDYTPLINLCSYGHDIEASWLIDRGLEVLNNPEYTARIKPITKALAEQIHSIALDKNNDYISMFNECEAGRVDTKKVWWVQAEAVLGFMNAGYTETAEKIWEYIKEYMIDKREGSEWYNELYKDNTPIENMPIVNLWKCPYHNGRMCLEIISKGNK
jgi:mannobiose 2-epimerase